MANAGASASAAAANTRTPSAAPTASASHRTREEVNFVRFAYTFSFLEQVNTMRAGMRFWKNLFVVHNLFTCDTDARRCRCKTYFNGRVWLEEFAELHDDINQLSEIIQQGIAQPDVREYQPVTTVMIHSRAMYDSLNFRVTNWQAVHAANESRMLESRLCQDCWSDSHDCKTEAVDLLFTDPPPDLSPVNLRR